MYVFMVRVVLISFQFIAGNISQQWKMNTFGFCMSIHWIYDLIAVDMYSKWTEVGVMKLRDLHLV